MARDSHPVVLLVEPNLSLNSLIIGLLTRERYGVLSATAAEQAMGICREIGKIDLLITDVSLFGANGIELANQVRRLHPTIKVLILSSVSEEALRRQGQFDGASVLEKPLALTDLLAKVDELIWKTL